MPENLHVIDLLSTFVHLQNSGHAHPVTPDREFWMGLTSQSYDRILGVVRFQSDDDLHADNWELHRAADELIVVLQGKLEFFFEEATAPHTLHALQAFVVPAGKWHRLRMREPGVLLFVNSRRDMDHKPVT
jgi:mannose-6-phosphate isomerase-like protein (cupin superfamily)